MYNTLVVTDSTEMPLLDLNVITFEQYLENYPKLGESRTRVINLCDTEQYMSRGYYCSLLAESRQHRVLPSVNTINDLRYLDGGEEGRLFIQLEVAKQNRDAIQLYQRLGYRFFGELPDYYEDHSDALRMQKRIRDP